MLSALNRAVQFEAPLCGPDHQGSRGEGCAGKETRMSVVDVGTYCRYIIMRLVDSMTQLQRRFPTVRRHLRSW